MRAFAAVLALVVLAAAAPALADVTQGDLEEAREQVRRVTERLADEVASYDAAVSQEAALLDRLDQLLVEMTARERDLVLARRAARDRAAEMYMVAGTSGPPAGTSSDVERLPTRYVYLEAVSQTDRDVVNRLEMARRDFEQQRELVEEAVADQESLRVEMEGLVAYIYGELDAANEEYQAVREEWAAQEAERLRREQEERERQEFLATSTTATTTIRAATTTTRPTTTTSPTLPAATTTTTPGPSTTAADPTTTTTFPPAPSGTRVCPVDGATSFTDSWGDPRPGGRTHTGTDMLAAEGTPLVAIEAGAIWNPGWHSAGGLGLYLKGDSGDSWYYAHLSAFVTGLVAGMRVEAGQRVGYVGHTGNASTPHLHLGWQPGGGAYQNPYPVVSGLC